MQSTHSTHSMLSARSPVLTASCKLHTHLTDLVRKPALSGSVTG